SSSHSTCLPTFLRCIPCTIPHHAGMPAPLCRPTHSPADYSPCIICDSWLVHNTFHTDWPSPAQEKESVVGRHLCKRYPVSNTAARLPPPASHIHQPPASIPPKPSDKYPYPASRESRVHCTCNTGSKYAWPHPPVPHRTAAHRTLVYAPTDPLPHSVPDSKPYS